MKLPAFLADKFGSDVVWSLTSFAVLALAGVAANVLIVNLSTAAAFGAFMQVYAVYMAGSQIAVGAVHLSVLKYVSHHRADQDQIAVIIAGGLATATLFALVVVALGYAGRGLIAAFLDSPAVADGLLWALPGVFFFSLNKTLLNAINAVRRIRTLATLGMLRYALILSGIVVILTSGVDWRILPVSLSAAELTLFAVIIIYTQLRLVRLRFDRRLGGWIAAHVSFGLRGFASGLFATINTRVDVLMLGHFLDDATVGVYAFASQVADGIYQISFYIRNNVDPILGESFADGTPERIRELGVRVRKFFYPLMAAVGIAALGGYPILLKLAVPNPIYFQSWGALAILAVGIVASSGYKPFAGIFLQAGRPGLSALITLGLVVGNVILNLALIPSLGIYGAATATATIYLLEMTAIIFFARIILNVKV